MDIQEKTSPILLVEVFLLIIIDKKIVINRYLVYKNCYMMNGCYLLINIFDVSLLVFTVCRSGNIFLMNGFRRTKKK